MFPFCCEVNKEIKVEDENMLEGFKDECENRFMISNDEDSCVTTASGESEKRKRKEGLAMNDVNEEKVEITTPNHDDNKNWWRKCKNIKHKKNTQSYKKINFN
jgi:hypothetical protein